MLRPDEGNGVRLGLRFANTYVTLTDERDNDYWSRNILAQVRAEPTSPFSPVTFDSA